MKIQVTILFFKEDDLRLRDESVDLELGRGGRAIIPPEYKAGKQIIAVLAGECHLLNRIGDRVLPLSSVVVEDKVDLE